MKPQPALTREQVAALEDLGYSPIVAADKTIQVKCEGCDHWMWKLGSVVKHGSGLYYHPACVLKGKLDSSVGRVKEVD